MTFEDRFWAKVDKTDSCWLWTGAQGHGGYGKLWDGERVKAAHRLSYEVFIGPIPEGLDLDHLCRKRACVNPAHLEPVTRKENIQRGAICQITTCKWGHPYDEANTWRSPSTGRRACRACNREHLRVIKAKRSAATQGAPLYVHGADDQNVPDVNVVATPNVTT